MVPVNNDFVCAADGVDVFVISSAVHAELVFPIETSGINWAEYFPCLYFRKYSASATHVAIGWGDRDFFLETETWDDLRFSTAANALLLPTATCLHVTMKSGVTQTANCRSVRLSQSQYERLVQFVCDSFHRDSGGDVIPVGTPYSSNDAFFESHGTYMS